MCLVASFEVCGWSVLSRRREAHIYTRRFSSREGHALVLSGCHPQIPSVSNEVELRRALGRRVPFCPSFLLSASLAVRVSCCCLRRSGLSSRRSGEVALPSKGVQKAVGSRSEPQQSIGMAPKDPQDTNTNESDRLVIFPVRYESVGPPF